MIFKHFFKRWHIYISLNVKDDGFAKSQVSLLCCIRRYSCTSNLDIMLCYREIDFYETVKGS